jgi:heme-degrading monooxygenase HmoA
MAGGAAAALVTTAAPSQRSIQLHVDLEVDPAKEKEMLHIFHTQFAPAAASQPGYMGSKMLKLRSALQGSAPAGANYRFVLLFQSEEQRQAWIKTPIHTKLWPTIENTLISKNYTVLLYDVE